MKIGDLSRKLRVLLPVVMSLTLLIQVAQGQGLRWASGADDKGAGSSAEHIPPGVGCGGVVTIQVKELCPGCVDFKREYPECPQFKTVVLKEGCTVNVCLQMLEPKQHSLCLVDAQAVVPCCVPGGNGLPVSGPSCLKPESLKCCDESACRWGCAKWTAQGQVNPNSTEHRCASEEDFRKDGLNPHGLPPCDCKEPGKSPLPKGLCSQDGNNLVPSDCQRLYCPPGYKCSLIDDCLGEDCCKKSENCRKQSPLCKEKACEKVCGPDGECFYNCSEGTCCCPENDKQKCLQDCALSGNPACVKAEAVQ
jgi:hypothetical protein